MHGGIYPQSGTRRPRQGSEFRASLDYTARPFLKTIWPQNEPKQKCHLSYKHQQIVGLSMETHILSLLLSNGVLEYNSVAN